MHDYYKMQRSTLEHNTDENGVFWTHSAKDCMFPERCAVHNRSDHIMRGFPQLWRSDRALMERLCPHGIGHPDPDHLYFVRMTHGEDTARTEGIHGCDGCCHKEEE